MGNIFFDITVIICIAAGLSIIFRLLKQPEILAYVLTGILIGPLHLFQPSNQEALQSMSQLGITFLLFMVGLEIRISDLFSLGKVLLLAAFGQILLTLVSAFAIISFFGFPLLTAFYLSLALVFSSTIIVVKLLSDKKDMHSLYAKFSIGILVAQDVLVIVVLMLLSGFNTNQNVNYLMDLLLVIAKGVLLFGVVIYLSTNVFPKIVELLSKSSETLFLASLAWVFGLAAFVSSPVIGFSIEIGGFLAGLALANSIANYQIIAKAKILRDFFIVIFFVLLGIQMSFGSILNVIFPAIIFSLFVLIGKPFIVMVVLGVLGYRKRTSFLTGISLSQISEFSLILLFLGNKLGHVSGEIVSLITLVGIITFVASTYLIIDGNHVYRLMGKWFSAFERKHAKKDEILVSKDGLENLKDHVVIIGGDEMGQSIIEALEEVDKEVVVVDFDPAIVKGLESKKIHRLFGDIADLDIQERAQIDNAKLVISTIPDINDNLLLLKELKHENRKAKIVMMALDVHDAKLLYKAGADYVVLPHLAGGRQIAKLIEENHLDKIEHLKTKDLAYLK